MKGSFFQTLEPDDKAIPIPKEDFYVILSTIEKDKKGSRQELSWKKAFDFCTQPLKAFPHTYRLPAEKQFGVSRYCQHVPPLSSLRHFIKIAGSQF